MNRVTSGIGLVLVGLLVYGLLFRDHFAAGQGDKKDGDAAKAEKRVLTTGGSATVVVKPDSARLYLTVETTAPTLADARARNNEHAKKVMDAVQALKIPQLKLKSTNVQMSIVYSRVDKKDELARVLGYQVTNSFTVLVSNDDSVKLAADAAKALDAAVENGANTLDQIQVFKQDLTQARREALALSTKHALANARALLSGAERTLTDVITINGDPTYGEHPGGLSTTNISGSLLAGGATPFVAGDLEVTCNVSVSCTYGPGTK